MTFTNHLLTGAALAKILPLPVAIPAALVSHFALDALPHFGFKTIEERMRHMRAFKAVVALDGIAAAVIAGWLIQNGHVWWLISGLVACSPDLAWIYRFTVEEKFGRAKPTEGNRFIQFHRNIQRYERLWGITVEVMYSLSLYVAIR